MALPAAGLVPPMIWAAYEILAEGEPAATADTDLLVAIAPSLVGGAKALAGGGAVPVSASSPAARGSVRQFFYDQIFFDSSRMDFGIVGASETRQITLWNSFMTPIVFDSFDLVFGDDTGIETGFSSASVGAVSGPDYLPITLPSLAYLTITLEASNIGPPEFEVRYIAEFTINDLAESGIVGEDEHSITATGTRAQALIPFPNWENGISEELQWLTSVVRTYTGLEHRAAMREFARRRLMYETLQTADGASRLRSMLGAWQNRAFMSPLWPYEMRLAANALVGQNDLVLDSQVAADCGVDVGIRLMPVAFGLEPNYEFILVESATVDSPAPGLTTFTMTLPLKSTWAAGSYIYPAGMAFVEGEVSVRRHTADVAAFSFSLLFDPSTVPDFAPIVAAPLTLTVEGSPDGEYEILDQEPNWVDGLNSAYGFDALIQDNQTGGYSKSLTREFPSKTWQFTWLLKTRGLVKTFREFLGRRRGQWKSFMAPSWDTDFTVIANIVEGQGFIICQPNGFDDTLFRVIDKDFFIEIIYGANTFHTKIISVDSTVAGQMRLNLDDTLPADLLTTEIKTCQLLETYRLGTDSIKLQWLNTEVVSCQVDVTTVTNNRRVS
jgi:hypothetical protein